ncbi:MAG TPA: hypothetical protein VKF42_10065, partial [Chitinivibrionales bacterium]|nr:hypothetical protein [Chitinivibrionales bacterium]
ARSAEAFALEHRSVFQSQYAFQASPLCRLSVVKILATILILFSLINPANPGKKKDTYPFRGRCLFGKIRLFEPGTPGGHTPPWRREEKKARHGRRRLKTCPAFFRIF